MKDVYGGVADWRRLVPRERDVTTGRRTGLRDDKRRDEQQRDSSPRDSTSTTRPSFARARSAWSTPGLAATGAALAGVLVVGGVMAGMALNRTPSSGTSASQGSGPGQGQAVPGEGVAGPSGGSAGTSVQASPGPSPSEAAATAILLGYSGGSLTADECSDASGDGACSRLDSAFDPLSVRCTPTGCTLFFFGGGTGSLAGPLSLSGKTAAAKNGCQETTWTLTLTPVGEAVTEGIRHPARLVGTGKTNRPAEVLPGANCLGATETYRYDATPS